MPWYNAVTGEHVYSPSDTKEKDELVYKPSIYAKEELPTWAEVYEEFYMNNQFIYDPNEPDDQVEDLFWKIPHKKFLIAVVCNQFNKMLYEDNMMDEITKRLSDIFNKEIVSLQFICGEKNKLNEIYREDPDTFFKNINEIYTIPFPDGKINPFIISNANRVDVNTMNKEVSIYPIIRFITDDTSEPMSYALSTPTYRQNIFYPVIDVMVTMFTEYFEGNIGWKDLDGNLIEGDLGSRNCISAGYETK